MGFRVTPPPAEQFSSRPGLTLMASVHVAGEPPTLIFIRYPGSNILEPMFYAIKSMAKDLGFEVSTCCPDWGHQGFVRAGPWKWAPSVGGTTTPPTTPPCTSTGLSKQRSGRRHSKRT